MLRCVGDVWSALRLRISECAGKTAGLKQNAFSADFEALPAWQIIYSEHTGHTQILQPEECVTTESQHEMKNCAALALSSSLLSLRRSGLLRDRGIESCKAVSKRSGGCPEA